jgi:hypothetical protein
MSSIRRHRRRRRRDGEKTVKDRLIQTRVPEKLENLLKEEAKKRRLTVSHLIRNMLEDTLDLVDTVVTGVDDIARSSAGLAEQVARDAGKIATVARDSFRRPVESDPRVRVKERDDEPPPAPGPASAGTERSEPEPEESTSLDAVLAWNPVVVNRMTECAECERELPRGNSAFLGITSDPSAPPMWLCSDCMADIRK